MTARLGALRAEIEAGEVAADTPRRLLAEPPGPREFRAVADEVVIRCPPPTRFALAEVAVRLVARDRAYREAAGALVRDARFESADLGALCAAGAELGSVDRGWDDLLWWHDLFRVEIRDDGHYREHLLEPHREPLLRDDLAGVLDYLLEPDRGPRDGNLRSFRLVIDSLGGCAALERRWVRWIRAGEFDLGWPDGGALSLGSELGPGLAGHPEAYHPLLDTALDRWRELLGAGDPALRRQGLLDVLTLAAAEIQLDGRVLREVLPAVDRTLVPEIAEVTSVCTAVEYAARRDDAAGRGRATGRAEALRSRLAGS